MTFFKEEDQQRIRYLHFKIKHLEEALEKDDENFSLDDLNLVLEYTMIINVNYKMENHLRILKLVNLRLRLHQVSFSGIIRI